MRRAFPIRALPLLAVTLALPACNAQQATPSDVALTAPPPPASIRVTPPGFHMPEGGGCSGDIARFRAVQDHDLAMGHVTQGVYTQIKSEIAEADQACAAGDSLRAEGLLHASKARHGYPGGS